MSLNSGAHGTAAFKRKLAVACAGLVAGAGVLASTAMSPARAAVPEGTGRAVAAAVAPVNLIRDPGAEQAAPDTSGGKVVTPHWTTGKGDMFTAVAYGASGGFPYAKSPGPKKRGRSFFAGGPSGNTSAGKQTDSLAPDKKLISAGKARFALGAYLGGFSDQTDYATLTVTWETAKGVVLGHTTVGPVTAKQRKNVTGLLPRGKSGLVPKAARLAVVTLKMVRQDGSYVDGYADNLSLTITR
jgi:hypothetical protein